MPRIDDTRPFIPVRIAVLTVSDTRDLASDKSGSTLVQLRKSSAHSRCNCASLNSVPRSAPIRRQYSAALITP